MDVITFDRDEVLKILSKCCFQPDLPNGRSEGASKTGHGRHSVDKLILQTRVIDLQITLNNFATNVALQFNPRDLLKRTHC